MNSKRSALGLLVSCVLAANQANASTNEKEELLRLRNTTLNLIDLLVQQGVLDKQKAETMVKHAEKKAADEARAEVRSEAASKPIAQESETAASPASVTGDAGHGNPNGAKGPVRVTYVPDFVKEEIRADVRRQLKDEVVKEVKAEARDEKWGIPAALPDWVSRIKPFGDVRLRFEDEFFGPNNQANSYYNWPLINAKGGLPNTPNPYLNTTEDRNRYRIRARFGFETQIVEGLKANIRLSTSNDYSPVSTSQTLGNYNQGYAVQIDRAFLQYDYLDDTGHDWFTLWGGRSPNPFFSTDNLYYADVNMEGFSGTFRMPFGEDDPEIRGYNAPNTAGRLWFPNINQGFTKPNQVYLTAGFFPLQEVWSTAHDKFMAAGQFGFDWMMQSDSRVKTGVAYYSYHNTQAQRDPLGSTQYDWTAPQFFTQGNSLARISNDLDPATEPRLVGLASRFDILDIMAQYDYTGFAPNHILLTGNYSKNLGFNQSQILDSLGEDYTPQTSAYQVRVDVGRPDMLKLGDWSAWVAYKYVQRDSVLDAFNDPNFHLGGTNSKGYVLGVNYGLANNVWANLRWLSSSVITGPTYDVNVLLADLNARF